MTRSLLGLMLLLGVVSACASRVAGTTIDYRLTDSTGIVKASLHIEPDGKMTRLKLGGETDTSVLDPAILGDLQRKIDEAQFPTLKSAYTCQGCPDHLLHTVSVQIDGVVYTVRAADIGNHPDRLMLVVEKLSAMCDVGIPWD